MQIAGTGKDRGCYVVYILFTVAGGSFLPILVTNGRLLLLTKVLVFTKCFKWYF